VGTISHGISKFTGPNFTGLVSPNAGGIAVD